MSGLLVQVGTQPASTPLIIRGIAANTTYTLELTPFDGVGNEGSTVVITVFVGESATADAQTEFHTKPRMPQVLWCGH